MWFKFWGSIGKFINCRILEIWESLGYDNMCVWIRLNIYNFLNFSFKILIFSKIVFDYEGIVRESFRMGRYIYIYKCKISSV